ncbi:MAG: hypothetical protein H6Q51_1560 [Deltaproteobacteria bacterium]|nr:hypothetical protein [Deltaproteobacteria bacterium]
MQAAVEVGVKEGAMRCPKCGYVSFDYLARCKKCSRDLADARRMLNLIDAKPAVPFLLGSLVGAAMQDSGRERLSGLSLTQETELELSNLDMHVSPAPEDTMEKGGLEDTMEKGGGDGGGSLKPLSAPAEPEPPSFELSLDDLAMEEGHGGAEGPAKVQDGGILGLDIDMDETGSKAVAEGPKLDEASPEAIAKELNLDEEGLGTAADELGLDTDTADAIAKELELDVDLKEDKLTTLTMELGRPAKSEPAPKGPAADDPMPELEAALLEMEKEL